MLDIDHRPSCVPLLALVALLGAVPAAAQVNLAGVWGARYHEDWPDRIPGPELGDYGGLPINAADRLRAETWDASLISLPEYQCRVHPSDYANSFADVRMWETRDRASQQLLSIHLHHFAWQTERVFWMDGRPHPGPNALHSSMGFSTGQWQGNRLAVHTTHLKEGWLRRNGAARSDQAVVTEYFARHGDILTWTVIVHDPIYLEEPFIRNRDYVYATTGQVPPYPCESVVEVVHERGYIPHHLPGKNPYIRDFALERGLPFEAVMGGAATMYPEYIKKMKTMEWPPQPVGGPGDFGVRRMYSRLIVAGLLLALCSATAAQDNRQQRETAADSAAAIEVIAVRDNIYMLAGAGGNTTVQIGADGVLLVDTQLAQSSDRLLAKIHELSDGPLRYIINTHYHPDHSGGNEALRAAGSTISGGNMAGEIGNAGEGAQLLAHENVLVRMSAPTGQESPTPPGAWPTATYFVAWKDVYFNGEGIRIMHAPAAHTDGDSIVHFRKSDVIATGDVFTTTNYPVIDVAAGGTYQGFIAALNQVFDLVVPAYGQDGGTLIVPGHGRLSDVGDLINYREMATIIRDRIKDMIDQGMTLAEVQAARPTRDYDGRYGATTGFWTTEQFVEAAYTTLKNAP